jgi:hypothetical protein
MLNQKLRSAMLSEPNLIALLPGLLTGWVKD